MNIIKSDQDDIFMGFSKKELKRVMGNKGRPEILGVTAKINNKVIRIAVCLEVELEKALKSGKIKQKETQKKEESKAPGQIKIVSAAEGQALLNKKAAQP